MAKSMTKAEMEVRMAELQQEISQQKAAHDMEVASMRQEKHDYEMTVKSEQEKRDAVAASKLTPRQKMGVLVGGVGVAVLALSVFHCTTAISMLTGSHFILATLLAVGIDCGLVTCELASIVSSLNKTKGWALVYIIMAVVLSCGLNGWASGHEASDGLKVAAWVVGGLIPVLVFVLGKVAGLLWEEGSHKSP